MVIDDKGTLVYRGAIDNSPDGEGESPKDGKLVSLGGRGARGDRLEKITVDDGDQGVRLLREVRCEVMKRLALLLGLVACGGKIEDVSTDPTTASGGPSPTTTTTSVPPSPPSPGQPTPTPTPPKDPTPGRAKTFTAQAVPGGRDHLMVFAADPALDSCVRVHLAYPSGKAPGDPYSNVVTPKEWGVEDISRSPGAKRCGPGKQPPSAERADDAKGTITFGPVATYVYPCTIDVHLAAVFATKPTVEQLDGDKIAVEGCQ